jgi:hypothetical protein
MFDESGIQGQAEQAEQAEQARAMCSNASGGVMEHGRASGATRRAEGRMRFGSVVTRCGYCPGARAPTERAGN